MAKMTVYHGGYAPVENPEIRIGKKIQRILEMDFTAQLSKNRHSGGPNGMIRKLYLSTMCGLILLCKSRNLKK